MSYQHYGTYSADLPPLLRETLRWVARTPTGLETLSEFLPLLGSGRVRLAALTPKIISWLTRAEIQGTPAGAFECDGIGGGLLFYDGKLGPDELAPLLFHELTHATDQEFVQSAAAQARKWSSFEAQAKEILSKASQRAEVETARVTSDHFTSEERSKLRTIQNQYEHSSHLRTFKTEKRAHQLTSKFVDETIQSSPSYSQIIEHLESCYQHVLRRVPSDSELIRIYGLTTLDLPHLI